MKLKLSRNQVYLLSEALRNYYNEMNYRLERLSIDDYNIHGHHIENDIRDIEEIMIHLEIRY